MLVVLMKTGYVWLRKNRQSTKRPDLASVSMTRELQAHSHIIAVSDLFGLMGQQNHFSIWYVIGQGSCQVGFV